MQSAGRFANMRSFNRAAAQLERGLTMKDERKFSVGDVVVLTNNVDVPYHGVAILAGERGTIIDVDPDAPDNLVIAMQRRQLCEIDCLTMIDAKATGVELAAL